MPAPLFSKIPTTIIITEKRPSSTALVIAKTHIIYNRKPKYTNGVEAIPHIGRKWIYE
jgi:hypothetical protein